MRYNIKNNMKNYRTHIAGILSLMVFIFPFNMIIAQVTSEASSATSTTTESQITQSTAAPVVLQEPQNSTSLIDTASSTQTTISADILVQTQDPNVLTTDTASTTVPVETSTTTAVVLNDKPIDTANTAPLNNQATSTDAVPLVSEEKVDEVITPEQVVATMPVEAIAPKSEFKFNIRTDRIATDKIPEWQKNGRKLQTAKTITNAPNVTLNAAADVPVVSGSCSDAYYVILIYKNEMDYSKDPASYIFNKAFPCVGGTYSYEINSLPMSISDGTYYLLVGGMGETGSWTPKTSLVPIDIMH